ncbi:hypothetical protein BDV96DRAFT_78498 [Lophiotrema nucula]|uniref:F-box domain-containing protein n=1 Tax=Lophiotrema nucula TaxID=690887 RepID=A0A6A5ZAH3_9PLEO|nr:hypothetical protein BDV96DRAFT_78498 [Lophiotrema nucula]
MESLSSRIRSSSIPRDYVKKRSVSHQFLGEDAAELFTKLVTVGRSLLSHSLAENKHVDFDEALHPTATLVSLAASSHNDAIEALVKGIHDHSVRRPKGIADAYVQAYLAAIDGRVYINTTRFEDVEKGADCTCSEALQFMPYIDEAIGTSLTTHFNAAYEKVKSFPLLSLPAELRLAVYSYALPRHKELILKTSPLERKGGRGGLGFEFFRVSKCINAEVTEYFYESRPLLFKCDNFRLCYGKARGLEFAMTAAKEIAVPTRHLLSSLIIQVTVFRLTIPNPIGSLVETTRLTDILNLFDNLKTIEVNFLSLYKEVYKTPLRSSAKRLAVWLIEAFPPSVEVSWTFDTCFVEQSIDEVRLALEDDSGTEAVSTFV